MSETSTGQSGPPSQQTQDLGERPTSAPDLRPETIREHVAECGAGERHFNELQSRYRTLASTWLLATFAGIGFVLSAEVLSIPVEREWVVAGIFTRRSGEGLLEGDPIIAVISIILFLVGVVLGARSLPGEMRIQIPESPTVTPNTPPIGGWRLVSDAERGGIQ